MTTLLSVKKDFVKMIATIVITIGGLSVLKGCSFWFHEEELPDILKAENPFYEQEKN